MNEPTSKKEETLLNDFLFRLIQEVNGVTKLNEEISSSINRIQRPDVPSKPEAGENPEEPYDLSGKLFTILSKLENTRRCMEDNVARLNRLI